MTHLQDILDGLCKLSSEIQSKLIVDQKFEEVEHIIKHDCDYNKSPGLDGLPFELYKATWDNIGQDFTKVLQVEFKLVDSDWI